MNKACFFSSLVALLVVLGAGFWLLGPSHKTEIPPPPSHSVGASSPAPAGGASVKITKSAVILSAPRSAQNTAASGPSIGDLLADSTLDNKAVMAGLAKMTLDANLSLAERTEAMSHLLNLSVEDPAPVLLPLITDARLPDALCEQILDDSLNDPLPWQADAYLAALAHRDDKEIQTKARDHLTFLVGTDYGDDPAEWTKAIVRSKEKWAHSAK